MVQDSPRGGGGADARVALGFRYALSCGSSIHRGCNCVSSRVIEVRRDRNRDSRRIIRYARDNVDTISVARRADEINSSRAIGGPEREGAEENAQLSISAAEERHDAKPI